MSAGRPAWTPTVRFAQETRGPALQLLFDDLKQCDGAAAAFIFGDFNEPSHRDWTARAVAAGHQPTVVRYPTTLAIEGQGFVDAFRAAFPDEVAKPAYTLDADERADRPS